MRGTIRRLFGSSLFLITCSAASLYTGSLKGAASQTSQAANPLAQQFGADPGDGWLLAGGFLMLVAIAFASAATMLWLREREG
jgi:hypothetical protein